MRLKLKFVYNHKVDFNIIAQLDTQVLIESYFDYYSMRRGLRKYSLFSVLKLSVFK